MFVNHKQLINNPKSIELSKPDIYFASRESQKCKSSATTTKLVIKFIAAASPKKNSFTPGSHVHPESQSATRSTSRTDEFR